MSECKEAKRYDDITIDKNGVVKHNDYKVKTYTQATLSSVVITNQHGTKRINIIDIFLHVFGTPGDTAYFIDGNKTNVTLDNIIFMTPEEEFRKSTKYVGEISIMTRNGLSALILLENGEVYNTSIGKQKYVSGTLKAGMRVYGSKDGKVRSLGRGIVKRIVATKIKTFDLETLRDIKELANE